MMRSVALLSFFAFGCASPSVPLDSSATSGNATSTSATTAASTTTGDSTTSGGSGGSGGGPPDGPWINATANLAGLDSVCGTLGWVTAKPDEDKLIAGVARNGLWSSTDGGTSWQQLGTGAGSAKVDNRTSSIVYDPTTPSRFWQTGIYDGHGAFSTQDDGVTFTQLGDVVHVDLVSVDFTDPARKVLLAGGHEQNQTLHRSLDGGMTWGEIGNTLPVGKGCNSPIVVDAMTYLVGCGAPFGGGGILRSTDGGMTWTSVNATGGATTPLRASDRTIYWGSPVGQGMIRSTDDGKTWTESPKEVGYLSPIELPGGKIAGLSGQYIMVSSDHAASWTQLVKLPYADGVGGLTYSAQRKAIYVWRSDCGNDAVKVPADGIMRYDFAGN